MTCSAAQATPEEAGRPLQMLTLSGTKRIGMTNDMMHVGVCQTVWPR